MRHILSRSASFLSPNAVIVVLLLALAVVSYLHFSETRVEGPIIRATILAPENRNFGANFGGHFALSPDGQSMAFCTIDSAGRTTLWIRPLSTLVAKELPGTEGAIFPFWSPDGQFIGFFAGGKLKKIGVAGAAPQVLCEVIEGRGGTWNQQGIIVFTYASVHSLFMVSASGGSPVRISKRMVPRP